MEPSDERTDLGGAQEFLRGSGTNANAQGPIDGTNFGPCNLLRENTLGLYVRRYLSGHSVFCAGLSAT
jgi:hypothetical protein